MRKYNDPIKTIDYKGVPIHLTQKEVETYVVLGMHFAGDFDIPDEGVYADLIPRYEGGKLDGIKITGWELDVVPKHD